MKNDEFLAAQLVAIDTRRKRWRILQFSWVITLAGVISAAVWGAQEIRLANEKVLVSDERVGVLEFQLREQNLALLSASEEVSRLSEELMNERLLRDRSQGLVERGQLMPVTGQENEASDSRVGHVVFLEQFSSRYEAERFLLRTSLQSVRVLLEGERRVQQLEDGTFTAMIINVPLAVAFEFCEGLQNCVVGRADPVSTP